MRNIAITVALATAFLFGGLAGTPSAAAATSGLETHETMMAMSPVDATIMGEDIFEGIVAEQFHGQLRLDWKDLNALVKQSENGAYRQVSPLIALENAAFRGEEQVLSFTGLEPEEAHYLLFLKAEAMTVGSFLALNPGYVLAPGEQDNLALFGVSEDPTQAPAQVKYFNDALAWAIQTESAKLAK
jgi:hypothetical protein